MEQDDLFVSIATEEIYVRCAKELAQLLTVTRSPTGKSLVQCVTAQVVVRLARA